MSTKGKPAVQNLYLAETWCAAAATALRNADRGLARQCITETETHLARAKELLGVVER